MHSSTPYSGQPMLSRAAVALIVQLVTASTRLPVQSAMRLFASHHASPTIAAHPIAATIPTNLILPPPRMRVTRQRGNGNALDMAAWDRQRIGVWALVAFITGLYAPYPFPDYSSTGYWVVSLATGLVAALVSVPLSVLASSIFGRTTLALLPGRLKLGAAAIFWALLIGASAAKTLWPNGCLQIALASFAAGIILVGAPLEKDRATSKDGPAV